MRPPPRILLALVLAAGCGGCAFFGHAVHGGTVALGAAAGAAVAGPAGAAGGAHAGDWGGELLAEQLTGTRGVRVSADGKAPPSEGAAGSLADGIAQAAGLPSTPRMNWFIFLAAAAVFLHFGGLAWLRRVIAQRAQADDAWTTSTETDRLLHKSRTEALERETARLEAERLRLQAEVDELWEKISQLTVRPLQP